MSRLSKAGLACAVLSAVMCHSALGRAQDMSMAVSGSTCPRPLCDARSGEYLAAHGSALALLALGTLITGNAFQPSPPVVRAFHPSARSLANAALTLELVLPVPVLLTALNRGESFDAAIAYGQVLMASELADHLLRPVGLDGSTTLAFGAAVSSAYLFDQSQLVDLRIRGAFWGVQLGLATANARLNVRGGRYGWGSAALGAGLGMGVGLLGHVAHGASKQQLEPSPIFLLDKHNTSPEHDILKHDIRDQVWVLSAIGVAAGLTLPLLASPAVHDPNLDYEVVPIALGFDGAGLLIKGKL